jgi:hypothetical protein
MSALKEQLEAIHKRIESALNPFTMMLTTRKLNLTVLSSVVVSLDNTAQELRKVIEEQKK